MLPELADAKALTSQFRVGSRLVALPEDARRLNSTISSYIPLADRRTFCASHSPFTPDERHVRRYYTPDPNHRGNMGEDHQTVSLSAGYDVAGVSGRTAFLVFDSDVDELEEPDSLSRVDE